MTMLSSREYTIQKNHIDPLGNIGKACIGFHFAYPKSSSHMNSRISEPKPVVNNITHCFRHLQKKRQSIEFTNRST